jgi:hypothetical protein
MWRFKAKATAVAPAGQVKEPQAADLTAREQAWIEAQRDALIKLAKALGLVLPESDDERLATCDELVRWWHREPAEQRINPNVLVNLADRNGRCARA